MTFPTVTTLIMTTSTMTTSTMTTSTMSNSGWSRMRRGASATLAFMLLGATAQAGSFDCSRFMKNGDGTWSAVQATELGGPGGRIDFMPNEIYKSGEQRKGLDIVKLLEANCDKK